MKEYISITLKKIGEFDQYIVWSIFFGTLHAMFSPDKRGFLAYLITYFVTVPIGAMSGVLANAAGLEDYLVYGVVSVVSLVSEDLIRFIVGVTGFARDNRETVFKGLFHKATGRKRRDYEWRSRNADEEDN